MHNLLATEVIEVKKTNAQWYPYPTHRRLYRLECGILWFAPMNSDGTRKEMSDGQPSAFDDDLPCEVRINSLSRLPAVTKGKYKTLAEELKAIAQELMDKE